MRRLPSFVEHLWLLWHLRITIGLNRAGGRHRWFAVVAFAAAASPSLVLATTFYALMQHPVVAQGSAWADFVVRLLLFVTSATWAIWPVLSAGVDDHAEISRYAAFPISSFRLMLASTLASLFEPRSVVFVGPVVGAGLGYLEQRPPASWPLVILGFVAYLLFNAALARLGLNVMLLLLRGPRSAELLGGGFVVSLIAASLIPPVDTSWLLRLNEVGAAAVPDTIIEDAALALGRFPTGWFGHALRASWSGRVDLALADALATFELALLVLVVAWGVLLHFHRGAGRTAPMSERTKAANPFVRPRAVFSTLVVREALDLWSNPRARLLASVPFVLAILMKLLSGRALAVFLWGSSADAWVMSAFAVYGAIVLASTFSQNAFAYDGHGFVVFLVSPVALKWVLYAKNLVHGTLGALVALFVIGFYRVYFAAGTWVDALCAAVSVLVVIPILLAMGNFLSLFFPVKFHSNLKRRDKVPFAASMLGVAAASLGTAPCAMALRRVGTAGPNAATALEIFLCASVAWLIYGFSLGAATQLLESRREIVLKSVTRE